ncbi:MAG TPA: tetratricopeptide repeat protein [Candidatus Krumholzibacteria bacterium]|nr:tetratricopeptide repeat protein [Candidatus Krumholzibacteria bacterium]
MRTKTTLIAKLLRRLRTAFAVAALIAAVTAGSGRAGAPAEPLSDIGLALDAARRLPAPERAAAITELDRRMVAFLDSDVPDGQKASARFLAGEIKFALGRYDEATRSFRDAEKDAKKLPLADDAALAAIQSLEAAGRDDEAEKEWVKWLRANPNSPARAEAMIARCWNAIRRDSVSLASSVIATARRESPWIAGDPRVTLAEATIAFAEGRFNDVTVEPSGSPLDPACVYLRALADEAAGRPLKAAARYQEVADRYNDPRLRDVALLAKANVYLKSGAHASAAEEFAKVVEAVSSDGVRAEARLRQAAATVLAGDFDGGTERLRAVASEYMGTPVAARAQMVLGEVLFQAERYEEAIVEFNQVLTRYFQHGLASLAQYRVGRCLDALGRHPEATGAYQTVVSGYPTSREAPAAAYLAGVGLFTQKRYPAAAPYFRLVLDRYAPVRGEGTIEFETPEKQELVEASLCLLELSYHRAGNLGLLSGIPHLVLQRMPPSKSPWRANALLIDADALAAQGRHEEAQQMLTQVLAEFNSADVAVPAYRLLAWSYSQEGKLDLAMQSQDRMLARYGSSGAASDLSFAYLNKAHILFNEKNYKEAAKAYESFLTSFSSHPDRAQALYQAGMCYLRLGHDGDAVDRWEEVSTIDPTAPIAEKALVRAGDVYFTAGHYDKAKRCYENLAANFAESRSAAVGMLRIAQCDYNAGRYPESVAAFSGVIERFPTHAVAAEAKRGIEQALYQLGQNDDGETVLAELVERFPSSAFAADAQFEIALRRYQAKDYEGAADAFRRVVSQFPSYSAGDRALYLMADSYSQAGRPAEARSAYEQFVSFFPKSEYRATVQLQLGASRFAEGDYMRAAVDFTAVLSDSVPAEVASAARYNLALCHRMLGEVEKSREMLEQYRADNPRDERAGDIAYQLGAIHEDAGRYQEAAREYDVALAGKLDASIRVEAQFRAGYCHEQSGDDKAALAAYARAARHDEKANPYRLSSLARSAALYEKNKDFGKALAAYKDLIKNATDPELVVAAKERANELESAGKRQ